MSVDRREKMMENRALGHFATDRVGRKGGTGKRD